MSDFDGHTPGPWHVDGRAVFAGDWLEVCFLGETPTCAWDTAPMCPNHEANGALIAAAPDLLAERDRLAETVAELVKALLWYGDQARLARLIHSEGDDGRRALASDGGERARAAIAKARGQA